MKKIFLPVMLASMLTLVSCGDKQENSLPESVSKTEIITSETTTEEFVETVTDEIPQTTTEELVEIVTDETPQTTTEELMETVTDEILQTTTEELTETVTDEIPQTATEEITETLNFRGFSSSVWLSDNGYYYFFYDSQGGRTSDVETGMGTAFSYEVTSDTEVMFAMGAVENKSYTEMKVIDENTVSLDWGHYSETLTYICAIDEWDNT